MEKKSALARPVRLKRTGLDWFGLIMMAALLVCSFAIFTRIMATGMLATTYTVLAMVLLLVMNGLHIFVQLPLRRNKLGKLICGVLSVLLCIAMLYGTIAVGALQSAINKVSGILMEKEVTAVIVMENDDAVSIGDTAGYTYGMLTGSNSGDAQSVLEIVQDEVGNVTVNTYNTPSALADALRDDEVQAIIMNEGYISILESQDGYSNFSSQTRIIYEYVTEHALENTKSTGNITKQPFVVYCSGIDARYGDITTKSLSDVNILAVVNPKTRQILLVSTPRDYYLPLALNGEMDKLTHAGSYGVSESMAVLDNLYGTETNYYARINFNGLMDIVDALGGVDVYSDEAFTTAAMEMPTETGGVEDRSFSFTEGLNHLNGEEALAFCRERYAFTDGDNARGRHQMLVIKAIINKVCSASVLANYKDLLDAVTDNFATSISSGEISSLVQMLQKDSTAWNIQSISATQGAGDTTQYCYSVGGYAWVMPPDMDSVNQIKEVIAQVMNGEEIVLPTAVSSAEE